MDNTHRYGGSRAPLSTLSSGHTYFTVESLQGITTLPRLPFSSSFSPPSAFVSRQSLPIHRGGRAIPSTHDVSFSGSSIRTHNLRETLRESIMEPYTEPINRAAIRNPITDREPIISRLQILRPNVAPSADMVVFNSKLRKNSDRGFHPKFNKRAHMEIPGPKDNSMAPRMPVRPGWCSLCDVDCTTKEILHKQHVFGKKHQSNFEKLLEEVSGDGKKPKTEQSQQLMGWCSLCEVNCGTIENLHKQHMLGKKHQLMLGIGQDPKIEEQETPEIDNRIGNIIGKRKQQIKEEGNMSSKKRQKLSDGESKKSPDVNGQEEKNYTLLVLAKDDAETGEEEETVLETKVDSKESEKDDGKESAEYNEVDVKKDNATGGIYEEDAETDQTSKAHLEGVD